MKIEYYEMYLEEDYNKLSEEEKKTSLIIKDDYLVKLLAETNTYYRITKINMINTYKMMVTGDFTIYAITVGENEGINDIIYCTRLSLGNEISLIAWNVGGFDVGNKAIIFNTRHTEEEIKQEVDVLHDEFIKNMGKAELCRKLWAK